MFKVILWTLIMMGEAFIVGFVVAYMIKIISSLLDYLENRSSKHAKPHR